jgi:hypothetical protein
MFRKEIGQWIETHQEQIKNFESVENNSDYPDDD